MAVHEWIKVVTHPLGLVGFALFLIFWLARRAKRIDERRSLSQVFLVAAVICLFGGLGLSYVQVSHTPSSSTQKNQTQPPQAQETKEVRQQTTGSGSPAIQGVQGNVSVTVDQSSSQVQRKKEPEKKEQPKKEE